jgi:hypothetical protein
MPVQARTPAGRAAAFAWQEAMLVAGRSHVFTRPLADVTRYWQGIPFLAPEVMMLIKARPGLGRPGTDKDQRDFEAALPVLSAQQRSWLKDAIEGHSRPPR